MSSTLTLLVLFVGAFNVRTHNEEGCLLQLYTVQHKSTIDEQGNKGSMGFRLPREISKPRLRFMLCSKPSTPYVLCKIYNI